MSSMSLRLPEELERRLTEETELARQPRSELMREALREFLQRRERERFMTTMVAEARAAYGNPETRRAALEIAEDFLPLDNEALEIAEGSGPDTPGPETPDDKWWR
ncbi:MAG: ribbon-helix-helix protein, CopG family [Candidatus Thiosymbion ectosymbiont of Robbea hypermnestra]|nr:ribbon-helix-helix protein, CopG family [Candidatus Thiosymbion ectosymbiont of Robbea hypermnestra]